MTTETVYKVLNTDRTSCNGGNAVWPVGEWMPEIEGPLKPCANGYHLCRRQDLINWLGPAIWVAEYEGERVDDDDKIVVRRARIVEQLAWNDRLARLFACDCAERVLPIAERGTDDRRPRRAIEVARRFANGQATIEELASAWASARASARASAWESAWASARESAWASARESARASARESAWASARAWQTDRLFDYLEGRAR